VQIPGQDPVALAYPLEIRTRDGSLALTLRLPLEDYVAAVLAGESAGFRSDQSMAAMAVAARTYAVRFQGRHKAEGYDFCDTTHCQDLRITAVTERVRQAAEQTEGELLWFQGSPAATFYAKDCGGSIEAAAMVWPDLKAAYLGQREDPYCTRKGWTSTIRKEELRSALATRLDSLRIVERTSSGRALRLQAGGLTVTASSLRFAVGRSLGWDRLPSDLYEVSDAGDRFVFEGRGFGHGVGLCQVGAARMGEEGRSYRQILELYYPGTKLGVAAQGFPWQSLGGERVIVMTTRPQQDQGVVAMADRLARAVEERSGLRWEGSVRLRIYPSVAAFRDATGEPGWVAGSTRAGVIRLQPQGVIEGTIRHELLHVLVESHARAGLPLWFREGAVLFLSGDGPTNKLKHVPQEAEARMAYAAALDRFSRLVGRFGEGTVIGWISSGLPPAAMQALATK
jgi:stage II sporulation protein D